MKPFCFFIKNFIALVVFMLCSSQGADAQVRRGNTPKPVVDSIQTQFDLALISCKAVWLGNGIVNVEWTVRNDGRGKCPLTTKEGNNLVSYTVDATGDKNANANAGNWQQVQGSTLLEADSKELAPGETATGSFTFNTDGNKDLVSYRVSLDCGSNDQKRQNNVYVGLIGK